jgi:hypothetical protein
LFNGFSSKEFILLLISNIFIIEVFSLKSNINIFFKKLVNIITIGDFMKIIDKTVKSIFKKNKVFHKIYKKLNKNEFVSNSIENGYLESNASLKKLMVTSKHNFIEKIF